MKSYVIGRSVESIRLTWQKIYVHYSVPIALMSTWHRHLHMHAQSFNVYIIHTLFFTCIDSVRCCWSRWPWYMSWLYRCQAASFQRVKIPPCTFLQVLSFVAFYLFALWKCSSAGIWAGSIFTFTCYRLFIAVRKICARGKLHWTDWSFSVQSPDWMRIRTVLDFQIKCILYGKQQ